MWLHEIAWALTFVTFFQKWWCERWRSVEWCGWVENWGYPRGLNSLRSKLASSLSDHFSHSTVYNSHHAPYTFCGYAIILHVDTCYHICTLTCVFFSSQKCNYLEDALMKISGTTFCTMQLLDSHSSSSLVWRMRSWGTMRFISTCCRTLVTRLQIFGMDDRSQILIFHFIPLLVIIFRRGSPTVPLAWTSCRGIIYSSFRFFSSG